VPIRAEAFRDGRFRDLVEIGRGATGVVFRATQPEFGRTVAIKVLPGSPLEGDGRARFERERRALGRLSSHPNIVTVYDAGLTDDGEPFLVMEHMAAGSLAERVRTSGRLGWREATDVAIDVASALETAHRAGLLHRDLKPENVLVSAHGTVKVSDFNIAVIRWESGIPRELGTRSVVHAAPEVIAGDRLTASSDVYSMASTVFELVAGHAPFERGGDATMVPLFGRIATEPVPDLRALDVPDAVCTVLEHALAKDPAARPPSAVAFARAVQDAQRALGVRPTPIRVPVAEASPEPPPAADPVRRSILGRLRSALAGGSGIERR
jgi:serine/threonine protein kinase